jgi:hypothetical protein
VALAAGSIDSGAVERDVASRSPIKQPALLTTRSLRPIVQMAMISFTSVPGMKPALESDAKELLVAREAYELGCLISIGLEDIEGFDRHYALVKSCYTDYASVMPPSENQHQLQGLNLLGLLAQSKIAEFHTGVKLDSHVRRVVCARLVSGPHSRLTYAPSRVCVLLSRITRLGPAPLVSSRTHPFRA